MKLQEGNFLVVSVCAQRVSMRPLPMMHWTSPHRDSIWLPGYGTSLYRDAQSLAPTLPSGLDPSPPLLVASSGHD